MSGENPYEAAAKHAVEGHPLPGENLETSYLDDADHWIEVYTELLEFKAAMIRDMNALLPTMKQEAVEEVERSDAMVLQAEADRFRRRLAAWERRRDELRAAQPAEEPRG